MTTNILTTTGTDLDCIRATIDTVILHGRKLDSGGGVTWHAVGPHVYCVRSATQVDYCGAFSELWMRSFPGLLSFPDSGLTAAMRRGAERGRTRGIYYCELTDTIRMWPRNHCLAVRSHNEPSVFSSAPDKASGINGHSLGIALRQHADAPTPQAMADRLTEDFFGAV